MSSADPPPPDDWGHPGPPRPDPPPPGPPARRDRPAPGPGWRDPRTLVLLAVAAVVLIVIVHSGVVHVDRVTVIYFCVLIPSIILHEVAHGAVAALRGDDTARRAGRLTLNPIAHVDPLGTIVLPAIMVLGGGAAFGYAKPVPVNVAKLRHPRNDSVWVSLAGPATNALLFVVAAVAFRVLLAHGAFISPTTVSYPLVYEVLYLLGFANIWVCLFNLLPVPPLDGSVLVERLLPARSLATYYRIRPYGMAIVLIGALTILRSPSVQTHVSAFANAIWNGVAGTRF